MQSSKSFVSNDREELHEMRKKLKCIEHFFFNNNEQTVSLLPTLPKEVCFILRSFMSPLSYLECRRSWPDFYRHTCDINTLSFFMSRVRQNLSLIFHNPQSVDYVYHHLLCNPDLSLVGSFLLATLHGNLDFEDLDLVYPFCALGDDVPYDQQINATKMPIIDHLRSL